MFSITVTEKGGEQRRLDFDKPEITIGRVQGNDVILPKGNVSKRHARIVLKDGKFIIVDLKSTNGTYVNGRKITSPLVVKETDKIYIGDFILGVEETGAHANRQMDPGSMPRMDGGPAPLPVGPHENGPGMGEPPMPMRMPPDQTGGPRMHEGPPPRPPGPLGGPGPQPPLGPPQGPPPHMPPMMGDSPMAAPMGGPGPAPQPIAPMGGMASPMPPPLSPVGGAPRPVPRTAPPRPAPTSSPATGPSAMAAPMTSRPAGPGPITAPGGHMAAPSSARPAGPPPAAAPLAGARPRLVGAGAQSSPAPVRAQRPQSVVFAPRRATSIVPLDSKIVKMLELQASVLDRLVPKLDLNQIPLDKLGEEELWQKAESAIVDMVETMDSSGELPKFVDQDQLIKDTLNEALGLGPLEDLLADEKVEEIVVDRRDRILVSRAGVLTMGPTAFSSDDSFRRVVERLVAPTGQIIDDRHPLVDVRLRDGSRLVAAVPPVAVRGACLTLRKPKSSGHSLADLISSGALSAEMADFLTTCIQARRNIVVCGAPGSGKSSLLTALAAASPEGERIVSVEEVAEMSLAREDWIALEAKPSEGNGATPIDLGALLRGALRMRPDRLVVGDVRGGEALELVQAMASSADGTIAVVSGEGARGALVRLTSMARLAAPGSSLQALRELVACAVDVVVHVARYADGVYRVASIEEIIGVSEEGFHSQELFAFRGSAEDGGFSAAGVVPSFYAELEARGIPADTAIFRS
jgi:pilus assembly protein CpaF